ncbi:hypothetical protein CSKR_102162, partial [Clonorchis sinensis]
MILWFIFAVLLTVANSLSFKKSYPIHGVLKKKDGSAFPCSNDQEKAIATQQLRQMASKVVFGSSFQSVTLKDERGQCRVTLEVAVNAFGRAKMKLAKGSQDVGAYIARKFREYVPKSGLVFSAETPLTVENCPKISSVFGFDRKKYHNGELTIFLLSASTEFQQPVFGTVMILRATLAGAEVQSDGESGKSPYYEKRLKTACTPDFLQDEDSIPIENCLDGYSFNSKRFEAKILLREPHPAVYVRRCTMMTKPEHTGLNLSSARSELAVKNGFFDANDVGSSKLPWSLVDIAARRIQVSRDTNLSASVEFAPYERMSVHPQHEIREQRQKQTP